MQFSSLPINSTLQNNPRYQFSLKSETIDNLTILLAAISANKIEKLLMVSDFNENWYLGVFCSEELVGNYEICIQGHFYEATIFKMAANKIIKLSMVSDSECNFHHYQSIPHFKITLDINFHWNQRTLKFCIFCWRPFWKVIFTMPSFPKWPPTKSTNC
jgi:hypothetical protein